MKTYVEEGEFAPKENIPFEKRNNVACIIEYQKKYGVLAYNEENYKSLVTGGIEEKESVLEAAKRECIEETGYDDILEMKWIEKGNHSAKFYVSHKNKNREALYFPVLIQLKSMHKQKISEEEKKEHTLIWLNEEEIKNFGMFKNHLFMFETTILNSLNEKSFDKKE